MKPLLLAFVAVACFLTLGLQEASAEFYQLRSVSVPPAKPNPQVPGSSGLSAGAQYLLGGTFCTAGTLIIGAAFIGNTQHRELSQEEAVTALTTCFMPPLILVSCNSDWQYNNSLSPATRRAAQKRHNIFCNGFSAS